LPYIFELQLGIILFQAAHMQCGFLSSENCNLKLRLEKPLDIIGVDGSFQNILGADTFLEAWQGVTNECGAPVAPHDGTATATYTFDVAAGTITINGTGAFLGLSKVVNGAELTSPADATASITYMATLSEDGNTLDLYIEAGPGVFWTYKLVKQ
jgi:hypothetical protein